MKRQYQSILLIVFVTVPIIGVFTLFQVERFKVRHEVKERLIEGMDKSQLTLIRLTKSEAEKELHWEHSSEFEYQGTMYDVVEIEVDEDYISYWCWKDEVETKLSRQISLLTAGILGANQERNTNQLRLITFLQNLYSPSPWSWELVSHILDNPERELYNSAFLSRDKEDPPTPPPLHLG